MGQREQSRLEFLEVVRDFTEALGRSVLGSYSQLLSAICSHSIPTIRYLCICPCFSTDGARFGGSAHAWTVAATDEMRRTHPLSPAVEPEPERAEEGVPPDSHVGGDTS